MYMILFVLHDPDLLEDVLTAWEQIGVKGVTVFPSTGLGRIRQRAGARDDLPMIPSLRDFYHGEEEFNRTIFTVVDNDDIVDALAKATRKVVGDLNGPDTGMMVVLPTARVYGLGKQRQGNE
jgi:nitrogen regulatory protein PII